MTLQEAFEHEIELANAENRTIIIFAHGTKFYVSIWSKNKWGDLFEYDRPNNVWE